MNQTQFLALAQNPVDLIQRKAEIRSYNTASNLSLLNPKQALNLTGGYNPSALPFVFGGQSIDHPVLFYASCYPYRSQIAFSQSSSHWLSHNGWWTNNTQHFIFFNFTKYVTFYYIFNYLEDVSLTSYLHFEQIWNILSTLKLWNYYRFKNFGPIKTPKVSFLPFLGRIKLPFIRYFYKKSTQHQRVEKNENIRSNEDTFNIFQAIGKLLVILEISWILNILQSYFIFKKGEKTYLRQALICMFQQTFNICSTLVVSCCIFYFYGYFKSIVLLGNFIRYLSIWVLVIPFLTISIFGTIAVALGLVKLVLLLIQFTLAPIENFRVISYYLWIISYICYQTHIKRTRYERLLISSSQRLQKIFSSIMDSFGLYSEYSFSEATNIPIVAEDVSKTGAPLIFKSIFVRIETTHIFENIDSKMLLYDFTKLIRQKLLIDDDELILLNFNGKGLSCNIPLSEFGLQNESTILISYKLVGGMLNPDDDYEPGDEEETPEKKKVKKSQKGSSKNTKDSMKGKSTSNDLSQTGPKNFKEPPPMEKASTKETLNQKPSDVDLTNPKEVTISDKSAQSKDVIEEDQVSSNPQILNNSTTNPYSDDQQEKIKLLNSSGLLQLIMSSMDTLNKTPLFNPNQDLSMMSTEEIASIELATNLWLLELAKLKKGQEQAPTQANQQKSKLTNPTLKSNQNIKKPDDGKKKIQTLPVQTKEQKGGSKSPIQKEKSNLQGDPTKLVASDKKVYETFIHDTPYKQPLLKSSTKTQPSSTFLQSMSSKSLKIQPVVTSTTSTTTTSSSSSSYKSNTGGAKQQAKGSGDPSDSSSSSDSFSDPNSSNEFFDESEENYEECSGDKHHKESDSEDDPPKKGSSSSKKDKKKKQKTKSSKHTHKKRYSSFSSSSNDDPCQSSAYENFNIEEAILQVLGTVEDRKKFRGKILKTDIKLKNVPIFTETTSFIQWWKLFRYAIQTTGLIGFVDQIEFLFHQCLEESIQQFLCEMDLKTKPTLDLMMRVVLSNYNKKPMSRWDYQELLNKVSKKKSENVSAYYLRFTTLAKQAENKDAEHLKVLFMKGLKPLALWKEVNGKLSKNSSLKDAYEWAIHFEEKYTQLIKHQEEEEPKKDKETEKKNPKPSAKPDHPNPKKNNPGQKNPQQPRKSDDKNGRTPRTDCGYCGKTHDFHECKEKYPFYKAREVSLILSVGRVPVARTGPAKKGREITKDTEWVKRLLEKKEKENTSDQTNAKVQNTLTEAPPDRPTFHQRKNQRKNNFSNQQKDSADDSSKKL
jgi:hypothetical protein